MLGGNETEEPRQLPGSGQAQDHPQQIIHHNRPAPSSPRPLSSSEHKDTPKCTNKGDVAQHLEGMEKVNIKILISGLKKLDLLNHLPPPSGGGSGSSPSTANATTTQTASAPPAPTSSTSTTPSGAVESVGGRSKGPMSSCYEVLYQEIKLPSENFIRFREWFSSVTQCEEKDALTIEEARNIIQFAHLHLSENPEVTRQYSITLLRKNCHLSPPAFYRLARWSSEIRELEKHKRHPLAGGEDTSAKWEAVKHCIHHGVFQSNRIAPVNGALCLTCAALETQPTAAGGTEGASRVTPQPATSGGELVRSQSSKDTRADQSRPAASGNGSGGLERSASGHTLPSQRESVPLAVCDRCGKPIPAMPPSAGSRRQLSNRTLGDGAAAAGKKSESDAALSPQQSSLAGSSSGLGEGRN